MPDTKQKSKSGRGGRRAGAGRKPSTVKGVVKKLPKFSAELILAEIKANQKLVDLASCGDPAVELSTIKFLWEQAYGKAKQMISGDPDNPLEVNAGDARSKLLIALAG